MTAAQFAHLIESSKATPPVYRSRVYGYKIEAGKPIVIIPHEADVIHRVFHSEDLPALALQLRQGGIRNRSGRPLTAKYLRSLIRLYYTGNEGIYPAIVSEVEYQVARVRLKMRDNRAPRG